MLQPTNTGMHVARTTWLLFPLSHACSSSSCGPSSTCSISPEENDGTVGKALAKLHKQGLALAILPLNAWLPSLSSPLASKPLEARQEQAWQCLQALLPGVEGTELGFQVLPDRSEGWGPIYWSTLTRLDLGT